MPISRCKGGLIRRQPARSLTIAKASFTMLRVAALVVLVSVATSCADLSEVGRFASSTKTALNGFSEIGNDFSGSATRRSFYVRDEEKPIVLMQAQSYKAEQPEMLAAQKVVTDYIAALAAIATDSAKSREKSIGVTKDGLQKIGMTKEEAEAGVGLATKVVDLLTVAYRSNKAGKAIHDCNPLLQEYLKGLDQIAVVDYSVLLSAERTSAEGYYQALLRRHEAQEPLAAVTFRRQMQQDFDAIEKKQQAALAFRKVLAGVGEGHQKLFDAGEHVSAKQLAAILKPYAQEIAEQGTKVAKAF
jgi:hypothetical protein